MGLLVARDPAGRRVWPWPAAVLVIACAVQAAAGRSIAAAAVHGIVAVLAWAAVRRAAPRYGTAVVTATLFAVHPVLYGRVATPLAVAAYAGALVASAVIAVAVAALAARGRAGARAAVVGTLVAAAALAAWTITLGR